MIEDPFCPSKFMYSDSATGISRRRFLWTSGLFLVLQSSRLRASSLLEPQVPRLPLCLATLRTDYPPLLEMFIAKLDPASDVFPMEQYAQEIAAVLERWSIELRGGLHRLEAIRSHLLDTLSASSLESSETVSIRNTGPLRIERRVFGGQRTTGSAKFLANWALYLSPLETLQLVELEIYGVRLTGESPLRVVTELRCDLVGTGKNGSREQRVGSWILTWLRDQQQQWKIQEWIFNPEVRSRLIGPGFNDITAHCLTPGTPGMAQLMPGIDDWRSALDGASGIDVYGNHGIAVGDIDGSGFDSFYVCQPSGLPNRLYRNRGDGTFEDITEHSGTGILDGTASALFADFRNRGKQDLLVVRTGGPLLFTNEGDGRFEARPDAFHFARPPQGTFTSVAAADYNRDGFLDLYFCVYSYYQGLNQYQFPTPYYDAQNGPPNFLFRNRGDGTFDDVTVSSGLDENNNRFSFAVAWCDYDNDGWPDIHVANDFGRKNLYRNNGDGTFTDVAAKAGVEDYGPGMSSCWLDYNNDGLQDLYVANMWLKEGKRITADDRFLADVPAAVRGLYQKHNAGNSLFRNTGKGTFDDKTIEAGSAMGRWSWSCASWDFDNDGYADLYVANGFVSGSNHYDLQSFFWRQVAQRSLTPSGASPEYEMAWNAVNELVRSDYSWSGYERNVFFANNRDGTFSDVSGALGLDFVDDSRAYALSDFDHDGRLEFVLKNRTGPQLRIIRNDLEGIGNSIAIGLRGRTSNRDAVGASVTIEAGATRQTKFVSAGSGFASQHTKELLFGIGEAVNAISISVRWPTGAVAHYDIPSNHRIYIEEGRNDFKATPYVSTPRHEATSADVLTSPATSATVSTWLIAPLFGPDISLPDLQGNRHQLSGMRGKPVLVTFFRVDCGDSRKQVEQLQRATASLSAAGLAILILAVDGGKDRAAIQDFARSAGISIPILPADDRTIATWNIQYRYLFDRRRDIGYPASFLLDTAGAIIRIYQGLIEPKTVIEDWKTVPLTAEAKFARAMPFPGPYYGGVMKHDYFTYGIAFSEYGYLDEAEAAFLRVVEVDPGHAAAWFNLGTIYLNKKQYVEAVKYLREAVRLNPQDADAWNNLGMISGEQGNYDDALSDFRRAARANPNHHLAVENMVRIYQFQARPVEAQKDLEDLIARAPNNADLHLGLAMTLIAQNDMTRAREELETALRLRPDNAEVINNLGAVLLRTGKTQEALLRFEESMRLSPDFDRPFINAALIYKSTGQTAKARQMLEGFLSRHPDDKDVSGALQKLGTS